MREYQPGDRVSVALPAGEAPGVVAGLYPPGFYLVRVEHGYFASVVVGPHRLRPDADPPALVSAD